MTQDLNGDGQEGNASVNGEITPISIYNNRNHRIDVIGFPAHGLFHRHTANDGSYSSRLTSQDAFIFYEHVRLPTNGNYFDPGDPAVGNLNNLVGSQWILGRVALLMRDQQMIPTGENYIARNFTVFPLSPLHYKSLATGPGPYVLTDSRYDLGGASLETLRQDVADVRANVLAGGGKFDFPASIWWQPLISRRLPCRLPLTGRSRDSGAIRHLQAHHQRIHGQSHAGSFAELQPVCSGIRR